MRDRFGIHWFFEGEGAGGGAGDGEGDKERRNLQNLLAKHNGDAVALASQLLAENADLRADKRELKKTQVPEGAIVLTGDEATNWTAYGELGKPSDLKKKIEDAESAVSERDGLLAEKTISEAAKLAGYDNADVLRDLTKAKEFRIELRGEGDARKPVALYRDGDKDAESPLSEYIESKAATYLPSLKAGAGASNGTPLPNMGVNGGKVTNKFDLIRQEVQNKEKAMAPETRSLADAGIN